MTTFQPLKTYPQYEISTSPPFIIRSTSTHEQLAPKLNPRNNYLIYELLTSSNEPINISLIRLLAIQFIPNPQKYKFVKYLDNDPSNNSLTNIKWISSPEDPWCSLSPNPKYEINLNPPHQIRSSSTHEIIKPFKGNRDEEKITLGTDVYYLDYLILSRILLKTDRNPLVAYIYQYHHPKV